MSHRKHSRYTSRSNYDRRLEADYAPQHDEHLGYHEHYYSRHTNPEEEVRPRRRRWAAGYIDRHSCPSHAYINTRSRSPDDEDPSDMEYIKPLKSRGDDYIQPREHSGMIVPESKARYERNRGLPLKVDALDGRRRRDETEAQYGSDVEHVDGYQDNYRRDKRSATCDLEVEEGSDIVSARRRSMDSDVASIHSRRRSNSRSGRRSIRSVSVRCGVKERRRTSSSESESEGGYISLDEYIVGRSDCVSGRSFSEDGGEGSDAVGSDVEVKSDVGEGSDVAMGSDVASSSDNGDYGYEEDCIGDTHDDHRNTYWRR